MFPALAVFCYDAAVKQCEQIMRKIPYRSLLIGLLALVAVAGWLREPAPASPQASTSTATPQAPTNTATVAAGNDAVAAAFARQQSNVQLHGQGQVQKTLPDAARRLFEAMPSTNKQLLWEGDTPHLSYYDQPEILECTVHSINRWVAAL